MDADGLLYACPNVDCNESNISVWKYHLGVHFYLHEFGYCGVIENLYIQFLVFLIHTSV